MFLAFFCVHRFVLDHPDGTGDVSAVEPSELNKISTNKNDSAPGLEGKKKRKPRQKMKVAKSKKPPDAPKRFKRYVTLFKEKVLSFPILSNLCTQPRQLRCFDIMYTFQLFHPFLHGKAQRNQRTCKRRGRGFKSECQKIKSLNSDRRVFQIRI